GVPPVADTVTLSGVPTVPVWLPGLDTTGEPGVLPPVLTNSSRFGEPVPGLVILPVVALPIIVEATCAGVAQGVSPRISAAPPTTCGVAIDVPLMVFVAVSLVFQDEVMFWPGAKMSVQVP